MNGVQEATTIVNFPESGVKVNELKDNDTLTWFEGLTEAMVEAFEKNCLPSELKLDWTAPAGKFDLAGYTSYPSKA